MRASRSSGEAREVGPGALCHVRSTTPRRVSNAGDDDLVMFIVGGKGGYVGRDGQMVDPADVERGLAFRATALVDWLSGAPAIALAEAARVHERAQAELDLLSTTSPRGWTSTRPAATSKPSMGSPSARPSRQSAMASSPSSWRRRAGCPPRHAPRLGEGAGRAARPPRHRLPLGTAAARPFRGTETAARGPVSPT